MLRAVALALITVLFAAAPVRAGEAAAAVRQALESGRLEQADADFVARLAARPADNEARFGLGMIRFALAIERFGRQQYRFGVRMRPNMAVPFFRLPVPVNPAPEEITYEKSRETWQALLDDLAKVEATLAPMTADDTAIVVDLNAVRLDFGAPGATETLGQIVAAFRDRHAVDEPAGPLEVKFDYADALWLRGYCQLMSAALEFVMAYDWRDAFNRAGPLFYPRLTPPRFPPGSLAPRGSGLGLGDDADLADLVVLIHEIRWPLIEAARTARALDHFKQAVALSRANWTAILAEKSDDREWIPGPQQKNPAIPGMAVTQEQVDVWRGFLDDADAVLDGKKLLPHWRFNQGINLKRALLEPRDFDFVLWAAGQGAAPYLESGPALGWEDWRKWNEAFGQNFLGYAFYFN